MAGQLRPVTTKILVLGRDMVLRSQPALSCLVLRHHFDVATEGLKWCRNALGEIGVVTWIWCRSMFSRLGVATEAGCLGMS